MESTYNPEEGVNHSLGQLWGRTSGRNQFDGTSHEKDCA